MLGRTRRMYRTLHRMLPNRGALLRAEQWFHCVWESTSSWAWRTSGRVKLMVEKAVRAVVVIVLVVGSGSE